MSKRSKAFEASWQKRQDRIEPTRGVFAWNDRPEIQNVMQDLSKGIAERVADAMQKSIDDSIASIFSVSTPKYLPRTQETPPSQTKMKKALATQHPELCEWLKENRIPYRVAATSVWPHEIDEHPNAFRCPNAEGKPTTWTFDIHFMEVKYATNYLLRWSDTYPDTGILK